MLYKKGKLKCAKTSTFPFLLGFKPIHHCGVCHLEKRNFEEQINHWLSRWL